MANVNFSFTRNPSTKISIQIDAAGLTPPDNEVILIGKRATNTPAVKEEGDIDFTGVANGAALDGTYFNLPEGSDASANGVAFWFDTDDSGTTIPAGASAIVTAGGRAVEITTILAADTPAQIATKVAAAILADAGFDQGSAATNVVSYRNAVAGAVADGADGAQATGASFSVTTQGADEAEVGTATTGVPIQIENLGDLTALATEVAAKFGSGSEVGEMVLAAANGTAFSDLDPILTPPVKAIPLADDETDITTVLSNNSSIPMPFAAISFPLTDATNRDAFKDHLVAISGSDRGSNGQFGSFGFIHTDSDLATVTPLAEGVARQEVVIPWLRDLETTKKNKTHEVAAASCMLCAANIAPFLPLNDRKIGGLEAPEDTSDHHTPGDAGTIAVGLESGLMPLYVDNGGNVKISRSVTASRRVSSVEDASYYDLQDWQVLYLYRKNAYNLSQQPRYKNAKGTLEKAKRFRSELINIAKDLENLEMLQFVQELADQFTFRRDATNRHAFIFEVPVNVIPGFHNKGIGVIGTTQFDLITV